MLDVSVTLPRWIAQGDRVGLAWSTGTLIIVCAGCMADHSMNYALVDPGTLQLASNVLELNGPSGLLTQALRPAGDSVLALFAIAYHVYSDGAVALLSCE